MKVSKIDPIIVSPKSTVSQKNHFNFLIASPNINNNSNNRSKVLSNQLTDSNLKSLFTHASQDAAFGQDFRLPTLYKTTSKNNSYWKNAQIKNPHDRLSTLADVTRQNKKKNNFLSHLEETGGLEVMRDPHVVDDMNQMDNLDYWLIEKRKQMISKKNTQDTILFSHAPQTSSDDVHFLSDENFSPHVNVDLMNLVLKEEDEPNERVTDEIEDTDQKHEIIPNITEYIKDYKKYMKESLGSNSEVKKAGKTQETMRNELNLFIFNELVGKKLKQDVIEKSYSNDGQRQAAVQANAQNIAQEIVSKFTALNNLFGYTYKDDLCFEYLQSSVKEKESRGKSIFSFTDEYNKLIKNFNKDGKNFNVGFIENSFQLNLKDAIEQTEQKKKELQELQFVNQKKISNIKKQKEYMDDTIQALKQEEAYIVSAKAAEPLSNTQKLGRRGAANGTNKDRNALLDYMKLNEIRTKKESLEAKVKDLIDKASEEVVKNTKEIERKELEISELNHKKVFYRMKLKEIYTRLLKKEDEILKFGKNIYQIIQSIWGIKETIRDEYFTPLFDKESINYALEYAKLEMQLQKFKSLEKKKGSNYNSHDLSPVKKPSTNFKDAHFPSELSAFGGVMIENKAQKQLKNMLFNVKERISDLKKDQIKKEKRVTVRNVIAKTETSHYVIFEENEEVKDAASIPFNTYTSFDRMAKRPIPQAKQSEKGLIEISQKMEHLQNEEIKRVLRCYAAKNCDQLTVNNLEKILKLITNEARANFELHKFITEKGYRGVRSFEP